MSAVGPTASIQANWPSISSVTDRLENQSDWTSYLGLPLFSFASASRRIWRPERMETQVLGSIWVTEIHWVPWLAVRRMGGALMRTRVRARYWARSVTAENPMKPVKTAAKTRPAVSQRRRRSRIRSLKVKASPGGRDRRPCLWPIIGHWGGFVQGDSEFGRAADPP
jgi:hypothetical protein